MADWIAVVDDDSTILKAAGHILSKHKKRVTALTSGNALLKYLEENEPDIILLDINMPVMDGFETLTKLREFEKENEREEIPVIFLTADENLDTENRGFEMGVSDYIRKPFDSEILVRRIDNILGKQERLLHFQEEASIDKLTGLYNKATVSSKFMNLCRTSSGYFLMIDLDSFKLVNDLYGHEMGDKILIAFSEILQNSFGPDSVIGRIGGDEFAAFSSDIASDQELKHLTGSINARLEAKAKSILGEDMDIPLGASIGAMFVTEVDNDYSEIFKLADKALYKVKNNGKHGCAIYNFVDFEQADGNQVLNMKNISLLLSERTISDNALQLDMDSFIHVYRFVIRYLKRYHKNACKILFTLSPAGERSEEDFVNDCDSFCSHAKAILRKSDLVMQCRQNQLFVFLTDIKEEAIKHVIGSIIRNWNRNNEGTLLITYEAEFVGAEDLPAERVKNRTI